MAAKSLPRINRRLLPILEAATYLGIGRSKLYELITTGAIQPVHIGSRTLLDVDDLDAYIEKAKGA